jgi:hypothetical protein
MGGKVDAWRVAKPNAAELEEEQISRLKESAAVAGNPCSFAGPK